MVLRADLDQSRRRIVAHNARETLPLVSGGRMAALPSEDRSDSSFIAVVASLSGTATHKVRGWAA